MKYLGSDSTETNLYQLLQRSIDIYNKRISVVTISVSTSTPEYKEYLKKFYQQNIKPVAEDNFKSEIIDQYVNLSLNKMEMVIMNSSQPLKILTIYFLTAIMIIVKLFY